MTEKVFITELKSFKAKAPKVGGIGYVEYCLWVDSKGRLYVEILENEERGTFTDLVYPVAKYAEFSNSPYAIKISDAFSVKNMKETKSVNNNDAGFLKAILLHLLPEQKESK